MRFKKGLPENFTFPATQETAEALIDPIVWNVMTGDLPAGIADPIYPTNSAYTKEFVDTANMVKAARSHTPLDETERSAILPADIRTAADLAEAVHSDFPTDFPTLAAKWILGQGIKPRQFSNEVIGKDFVTGVVSVASLLGEALASTSPKAFTAKWHFGVPRPEEVAGGLVRGEKIEGEADQKVMLEAIVNPEDVKEDQNAFTTYPEGAPHHPAYPAMHSAVGGAFCILEILFDLTKNQKAELNALAINVAYGRSYSGVHTPQDNVAGLGIGEHWMRLAAPLLIASKHPENFQNVFQNVADVTAELLPADWAGIATKNVAPLRKDI